MSEKTPPKPPPKPKGPQYEDGWGHPWALAAKDALGDAVEKAETFLNQLILTVKGESLIEVCKFFKAKGFPYLVDIAGVHYPEKETPFLVTYLLHNMDTQERVRLKVWAKEDEEVPSVTGVWKTANWLEREAYDMVGIRFSGHPNLKRILLWEGFQGHPLRKDFPLEGRDTGASIYEEDTSPNLYKEDLPRDGA